MAVRTSPRPDTGRSTRAARDSPARLTLLQGFELTCAGLAVHLPLSAQRVIAFVALHNRPLIRTYVAGSLWPDVSEFRARASLRSALWRLNEPGYPLVETTSTSFQLRPDVEVDVRELEAQCHQVLSDPHGGAISDMGTLIQPADLLPGWYEDWVLFERERVRQLRLHALEAVCQVLIDVGKVGLAVDAGLAAASEEPLRESAHRLLIKAHAAGGNVGEAYRQYRLFRRLLQDELGLEPSVRMEELIRSLR